MASARADGHVDPDGWGGCVHVAGPCSWVVTVHVSASGQTALVQPPKNTVS